MRWTELPLGYRDRISQMAQLPPHELLGVPRSSSEDDIKTAYLQLVKTYHPDVSDPFMARHNEEMIKLINIAYERLRSDPR